jgi:hypothetical protein
LRRRLDTRHQLADLPQQQRARRGLRHARAARRTASKIFA